MKDKAKKELFFVKKTPANYKVDYNVTPLTKAEADKLLGKGSRNKSKKVA